MKLDLHPVFPSTLVLAPRVQPGVGELGEDPATPNRSNPAQIEMVLAGIVKATYAADDPFATPLADPEPLLDRDVPFNPLANPDFAEPALDDEGVVVDPAPGWQAAGPSLGWLDHGTANPNVLVVTGGGDVTQTTQLDRPLGGRTFALDVQAALAAGAADAAGVVHLQVRSGSGVELFAGGLAANLTRGFFTAATGSAAWPGGLADTSVTVVLRGLSAANPVWYDQVHLHEGRVGNAWDFNEVLRYEHDVAPYKPHADVVVLGSPREPAGRPSPATLVGGTWTEEVALGAASAAKTFSPGVDETTWPFTFGWQTRLSGARGRQATKGVAAGHAGWYGDADPEFDPAQLLPIGFHNRYQNGGEYAGVAPPFAHPAPGDAVTVTSEGEYQPPAGPSVVVTETHSLHLPATAPELRVTYLDHCDDPVQETVALTADTIVYDRDLGRFSVTWRGVWPFASRRPERYVAAALRGGA